ncbi:Segregation and condensation protein A [Gammaproteobacteria bacterium]
MTISARVHGESWENLPKGLYIPPDALEVVLAPFEGPLDLLLYLIRHQNFDILEIPIAEITRQYLEYIETLQENFLDLAAEYLAMAAWLCEIKSRLLLPQPVEEGPQEDPRTRLIQQLQEYERFKSAAENLDRLPRIGRDLFEAHVWLPETIRPQAKLETSLEELLNAWRVVSLRSAQFETHHVIKEPLSVQEKMLWLLKMLEHSRFTPFFALLRTEEGKGGIVVTLLAVLELVREHRVEVVQTESFSPIQVRASEMA